MKNKKLFAILTLVCFMFTLMPVAAFAMDEQKSYVYVNDSEVRKGKDIEMELTLDAAGPVYVWFEEVGYEDVAVKAVEPGTAVDGVTVTEPTEGYLLVNGGSAKHIEFNVKIDRVGEYKVHACDASKDPITNLADFKEELRVESGFAEVVVSAATADSNDYVLKNVTVDGTVVDALVEDGDVVTIAAADANGIEYKTVSFTVYEDKTAAADTVYAGSIDVDATSGVDVTKLTAKRSGLVSFNVTANKAGTHKVYVTIGDFKATIKVNANEGVAEEIETFYVAQTPVNKITANSSLANSVVFKIYDENGNELLGAASADCGYEKAVVADNNYVAIVDQPKDSDIENDELSLVRVTTKVSESNLPAAIGGAGASGYAYSTVADGWTIAGANFEEEGSYTFKVALDDGTSAKATIKVMKAGDPVALNVTYKTDAVQLGDSIKHFAVVHLDKNYVATSLTVPTDVEIAVSGAAVAFVNPDGTIQVKNDEKYVGSEIKVTFIDKENNLVATKVLTVAAEAKDLALDVTAVPVDTTRTITASLVDENGKAVGLSQVTTAEAYVIVLDKPADSDVSAEVKTIAPNKGQFTFAFSADAVGVVKVQTVLQTSEAGVVRYYTGTQEIKVGATGIEDVVVMSINSNQIVVNDVVKTIDAAPIVKDARTFVPFRALAEAFGATVEFDAATQAVVAELDGTKVVMTIGAKAYTVNGVAKTADVAPFISDSRTMVPVRFVAEAFGITVTPTYDDNGATADILFAK